VDPSDLTTHTVTTHALEVARTARYHVLRAGASAVREVWFLLHGYGQLAGAFLAEPALHDALARPGSLLVAPEALSRFYLRRGTGTVGASWMTREERASEIADVLRYLDAVWARVRAEHAGALTLSALGFSQGGAAAARWAVLGAAPVATVVSFACPLPPDLDLVASAARARAVRWAFALGDADDSIERAAFDAGLERLRAAGIEPEVARFAGGHALEPGALARLTGS
jgi:predicted esterase